MVFRYLPNSDQLSETTIEVKGDLPSRKKWLTVKRTKGFYALEELVLGTLLSPSFKLVGEPAKTLYEAFRKSKASGWRSDMFGEAKYQPSKFVKTKLGRGDELSTASIDTDFVTAIKIFNGDRDISDSKDEIAAIARSLDYCKELLEPVPLIFKLTEQHLATFKKQDLVEFLESQPQFTRPIVVLEPRDGCVETTFMFPRYTAESLMENEDFRSLVEDKFGKLVAWIDNPIPSNPTNETFRSELSSCTNMLEEFVVVRAYFREIAAENAHILFKNTLDRRCLTRAIEIVDGILRNSSMREKARGLTKVTLHPTESDRLWRHAEGELQIYSGDRMIGEERIASAIFDKPSRGKCIVIGVSEPKKPSAWSTAETSFEEYFDEYEAWALNDPCFSLYQREIPPCIIISVGGSAGALVQSIRLQLSLEHLEIELARIAQVFADPWTIGVSIGWTTCMESMLTMSQVYLTGFGKFVETGETTFAVEGPMEYTVQVSDAETYTVRLIDFGLSWTRYPVAKEMSQVKLLQGDGFHIIGGIGNADDDDNNLASEIQTVLAKFAEAHESIFIVEDSFDYTVQVPYTACDPAYTVQVPYTVCVPDHMINGPDVVCIDCVISVHVVHDDSTMEVSQQSVALILLNVGKETFLLMNAIDQRHKPVEIMWNLEMINRIPLITRDGKLLATDIRKCQDWKEYLGAIDFFVDRISGGKWSIDFDQVHRVGKIRKT